MRTAPRASGLVLILAAACWPAAAADARPGVGPHQTVDQSFSTTEPGSPIGITYSATFHNPSGALVQPALRRLILGAPAGAIVDTSVPARCTATDAQLKQLGAPACPAASRIGTGTVVVKPLGLPQISYRATVFNAKDQQVELLEGDPPSPRTVVRAYYRDGALDSPVPTCLNGGFVPGDCSFDQVALLRNSVNVPAYSVGGGASRRSYLTSPRTCPRSREWVSPGTFSYGDGAMETVTTTQACRPAPTRIRVFPRRVRRLSQRRLHLRASVRLGGRWVPLGGATIRFAGKKRRTNRRGQAAVVVRFRALGRRRARLSINGYSSDTTRIRVLNRRR